MGQISDYSSLFEVGIGIGIALSLFRIPVDNKKLYLATEVNSQLQLYEHQSTPLAVERYELFAEIAVDLDRAISGLESKISHYPVGMLLGAAVNVCFLIISSFDPQANVSAELGWFYCFVSFGWFGVCALVLVYLVDRWLGPIEQRIRGVAG